MLLLRRSHIHKPHDVQHSFIDTFCVARAVSLPSMTGGNAVLMTRRQALIAAGLAASVSSCTSISGGGRMYGLIGKALAKPGERDALIAILLEGTTTMPGCLS